MGFCEAFETMARSPPDAQECAQARESNIRLLGLLVAIIAVTMGLHAVMGVA